MQHPQPEMTTKVLDRLGLGILRFINSPRTVLVLLCVLLIVALLGGVLPRAGAGLSVASYRPDHSPDWVGSQGVEVRRALSSVVAAQIFRSRFFLVFLAITAAITFLRMLFLWVPSWAPPPAQRLNSYDVTLRCDTDKAWEKVSRALAAAGQSITRRIRADGIQYAVARRRGIARWLAGVFYLGLLTLFVASLVAWHYGWVGPLLDLTLGELRPLDESRELQVRLEQIELLPQDDGTMRRFDSRISLRKEAQVEKSLTVGLGKRALYEGLSIYQLGFGPAIRVTAQRTAGESLSIQHMAGSTRPQRVLRVGFSGRQQEQLLAVPQADIVVRLVYYPAFLAQGTRRNTLHVQMLRGSDGRILTEEFITDRSQILADGVKLNIAFEYYVTLRAEREPELPLLALGGVLIVLGMLGFVAWPPREIWIAMCKEGSSSRCHLFVPQKDAGARWFQCIEATIREEGND